MPSSMIRSCFPCSGSKPSFLDGYLDTLEEDLSQVDTYVKSGNLMVDKYPGFLNLQNQPGVFAAEVLLPLTTP